MNWRHVHDLKRFVMTSPKCVMSIVYVQNAFYRACVATKFTQANNTSENVFL